MASAAPIILWFREDLRLADNPALSWAAGTGRLVICLYIRETGSGAPRAHGGASNWWLDKSLKALGDSLEALGGRLVLRTGEAGEVIRGIARESGADAVVWNRRYGQPERDADAALKDRLKALGLDCRSFNGRLLVEPWELKTGAGGWYRVFTPFWKALQANYSCPAYLPPPKRLETVKVQSEELGGWGLHPTRPDWSSGLAESWTPGEAGAAARLDAFLDGPVDGYSSNRNRPDLADSTSALSPHLRFGEISPVTIWRRTTALAEAGRINEASARVFLSEIAWREFSYTLLYFNPDLATENYNPSFDAMPWQKNADALRAWQRGMTGYPIVDAGMRQLWHTGWMHNRVRMIVASFLTKHLLLPWQAGEAWFWDTLVDADPASNPASWQWTAGSGADAAPYFRVFNPITQGQKFDETGEYVRRWCPELAKVPLKFLHAPFEADGATLARAGVDLGVTYPKPIIDHSTGRERALGAYQSLKEKQASS
ncbi:cryptochrome/photolyase family protein [Hyphomonas sp.]|uniref:cryptochrome/photolyase family protein n=1 Tax=Hyphomonas sp. TaxID=87 RepID=UPI00391B83C6